MEFEDMPKYEDGIQQEKKDIVDPEISTDLAVEEGKLELQIMELQKKLDETRRKRKEEEYKETPEGKKWLQYVKENAKTLAIFNANAFKKIEYELLLAKRARALEIIADEYLKRHRIRDDDKRVQELVCEIKETREAISGLHFSR